MSAGMEVDEIESLLRAEAETLYDVRTLEFGEEMMGTLERAIMLRTIDAQWVDHLTSMDNMRQGIGLQAAGQRDPLVQYKRQSYEMFTGLLARIETQIARTIFRVALAPRSRPNSGPADRLARSRQWAVRPSPGMAGQPGKNRSCPTSTRVTALPPVPAIRRSAGTRGAPCGSGKKYKRCCGRN